MCVCVFVFWQTDECHKHAWSTVCVHGQVALYRASDHENEEESTARVGRLSFVDLAGSERANRTGNVGARLKYAPLIDLVLIGLL